MLTRLRSVLRILNLLSLMLIIAVSIELVGNVRADVVDIPDPNLRKAIENELDKEEGEEITEEDMLKLQYLFTPNKVVVKDLTGLETATNLEILNTGGAYGEETFVLNLTPIRELMKLERLVVVFYNIQSLEPIHELTNIEILGLSNFTIPNNDISPIGNLTKIEWLIISNSDIVDITVIKNLTNIAFLSLRDNRISDISPIFDLPKLETLLVEGNPLSYKSQEYITEMQNRNVEVHYDEKPPPTDVNQDGTVNILDLVSVANAFNLPDNHQNADVNQDGTVNILDLVSVANNFGDQK